MNNESTGSNQSNISNDDVISTLNGLIEICRDGQEGFREAAESVNSSDIKTFFVQNSQQLAGALESVAR